MSVRPPCSIGGEFIKAGSHRIIRLPLPDFYTHSPTTMPVHVIHGRHPGPCLLVASALHGDEINGVEIIRRLRGHPAIKRIKGTLILIPVMNVFGFISQSRYLPDRRDLNRSFPGSPKGSMAARLANLITTEILPVCSHIIEIHAGSFARENLPQIRATFSENPALEEMAKAFNAPVVLDICLRAGTFRETAQKQGVCSMVYEAGEALRFDEVSIRAGVAGVLNVLSYLGMIRKRSPRKAHTPLVAKSTQWIRAPQSGVLRSLAGLGDRVTVGAELAVIGDPFGEREEIVLSPVAGIVIGRTKTPLIHEGEAVFHIARFSRNSEAAESVENFQDAFDPENGLAETEEPPLI